MGTIAKSPICVGGLDMRLLLEPDADIENATEFGAPIFTTTAELENAGLDMQYEIARSAVEDYLCDRDLALLV